MDRQSVNRQSMDRQRRRLGGNTEFSIQIEP